jgi:hypothetical protein
MRMYSKSTFVTGVYFTNFFKNYFHNFTLERSLKSHLSWQVSVLEVATCMSRPKQLN